MLALKTVSENSPLNCNHHAACRVHTLTVKEPGNRCPSLPSKSAEINVNTAHIGGHTPCVRGHVGGHSPWHLCSVLCPPSFPLKLRSCVHRAHGQNPWWNVPCKCAIAEQVGNGRERTPAGSSPISDRTPAHRHALRPPSRVLGAERVCLIKLRWQRTGRYAERMMAVACAGLYTCSGWHCRTAVTTSINGLRSCRLNTNRRQFKGPSSMGASSQEIRAVMSAVC